MNHTGLEFRSSILQNSLSCFSPKIHLQDLWKRFQFVLDHNLGHFKANLFDRAEIVMEAGVYSVYWAFQVRLNLRSEPRTKQTPNPQILARVSLLASHERLREKRLCLAGVQAIKSRFFAPIYRKYLYILSYPGRFPFDQKFRKFRVWERMEQTFSGISFRNFGCTSRVWPKIPENRNNRKIPFHLTIPARA